MIKAKSSFLGLGLLLLAACALGGCSFTTVTADIQVPKPGPKTSTGLNGVMPQVKDLRTWPAVHAETVNPNIRLFAPVITEEMRKGLIESGLFRQLKAPSGPVDAPGQNVLEMQVQKFKWARMGQNEWVVAQLVADGLLLPAYTVVALASQGEIDMGGYIFPSTKLGTDLNFTVVWKENKLPVLTRTYLVSLPLGAVSERKLHDSMSDLSLNGVKLGKEQGVLALKLACATMTRDPRWGHLPEYRILAQAEEIANDAKGVQLIQAARTALPLLKPLAYSPEVATVLRDGALTASMRAAIANDLTVRNQGLADPDQLAPDKKLDEAKAKTLFDNPLVEDALVKSELAQRAFALMAKAMAPQAAPEKPKAEAAPATKVHLLNRRHLDKEPLQTEARAADKVAALEPAEVLAQRQAFIGELARQVKGKPNLQAILLKQADKAVGPDWQPMLELLRKVDSPLTRAYLQNREG